MRDDDQPQDLYKLCVIDETRAIKGRVSPEGDENFALLNADENVVIQDDEQQELRVIPEVIMAKARAQSVSGLLLIIGLTILLGFVGIFSLSVTRHPTDALREVLQTALTVEVTVLASSLGRSGA